MDLWFLRVVYILILSVCTFSIWRSRHHFHATYYFPWFLLVTSALTIETFKFFTNSRVDNILHHMYQVIELVMMVWLYERALKFNWITKHRNVIVIFGIMAAICLSTFLEGWTNSNNFSYLLTTLFVVAATIAYFLRVILPGKNGNQGLLWNSPFFWINSANLLYYSGIFFYEGISDMYDGRGIIYISVVLNYLLYTLYIVGSLCKTR